MDLVEVGLCVIRQDTMDLSDLLFKRIDLGCK